MVMLLVFETLTGAEFGAGEKFGARVLNSGNGLYPHVRLWPALLTLRVLLALEPQ